MVLIRILMTSDAERSFMYLLAVSMSVFLEKYPESFAHPKVRLNCVGPLCILDIIPLSDYIICKYFVLSSRLPLSFVACFFSRAEAF